MKKAMWTTKFKMVCHSYGKINIDEAHVGGPLKNGREGGEEGGLGAIFLECLGISIVHYINIFELLIFRVLRIVHSALHQY